jgi:PAS domain S-box-containing protein
MDIKNQIRLSVLISLILVVAISASIFVSYQNMQNLRDQEALAADVVRGGYELTYLSNDYLINAEPRARLQWEERYISLQPIISQLKPENKEEARSLEIIRDYNEKSGVLFREIPVPGAVSAGANLFPANYQQVTWSRINVQSQGMIYEAWRLRHMYNDDVSEARFWNNILVVVLMVLMLIIIGINYLLISRRLVRSIREVNKGSEVFATGNLDYRIPVHGDDEIGGIAQRLNTMAEQIRAVTASRDELDREITGRKVAEEARLVSETRFSELFDTVSSGVAIYEVHNDGESGKDYIITDFNKAALALEGKKKEDIIGKSLFDLRPAIDDYGLIPLFKEVWKSGEPAYYPATIYVDEKYANYYENRVFRLPGGEIVAIYNDITEQKQAEIALQESAARLSLAQDIGNAGVWEWNLESNEVFFDARFHAMLGYMPGELPTTMQEWLPYHNPEDTPIWMAKAEAYIRGDVPAYESEHRIRTKAGDWAWVFTRGQLVNLPSTGTKKRFIGLAMNTTGRKRAEAELVAVQQQYHELFKNVSIGILRSTPGSQGTIIEANPAALTIFEADSREQFLAVHPSDLYFDADQRRRISEEIVAKGSIDSMEVRYKTLKGRAFWGRISSIKKVSEDGQIYFDNTIEDVTGSKEAEAALRESEEKFSTAFKTSPYAITITRIKDGSFIEVNDAFTPITGFTYEEAKAGSSVGLNLWVDTEDRKMVISALYDGRSVKGEEFQFRRKDGGIITGLFSARIISIKNEPCILSSISDITDRKRAEEKITSSEMRYRRLFESAKDGILILNRDNGEIIDANPFIQTLIGYSREELIGKHLWDIGLLKDYLLSKIAFEELQAKEYLRYEDLPLQTRDGRKRDVEFVSNVYPINPQISVIQCNIRDITDRVKAEDALRETSDYLRNLLDYANAPIIVWDTAFRISRFNHAFERMTGRTEQGVIGQHLALLFPESSRDASLELIRKTMTGEQWEIVEIPILHVSGEIRIVLWNSANIVDPKGAIISTIAQGQDITGRKSAEDALRQSEEKYRVLFTRMVEGSALHEMVFDPSGNPVDYRIVDVNPAFESVIGIRREDVIGKTSREAYGIDVPPYLDIYARVAVTGQPEWFEVYFAPMKKHFAISAYSTKKGRFATIFEDITDRKRAEVLREHLIQELEQKNAELERFTYTVSHDLKSPLITIKGFAGLLEDDALKGDPLQLKKDINRITVAADTMQELLADVLELSRIGRVVFPPEKTSFGTIAQEAVDLLAGPLAEQGVTVDIAPDLPLVNVDHARIREVMVNLIENAIKFLGTQQEPVIRIGVEMDETTPVFFVQDNGIGINPRYLERIFNLFERLDVTTHGTGIGLTIVRRIIEVHGGKIWAKSEGEGKGTTFRFTLPGVPADRDTGGS